MTTIAVMLTRDRRATVEVCLPAWAAAKGDMELWCFDDGSTEYDAEWLRGLGADRVFPMTQELIAQSAAVKGSWRVACLIQEALRRVLNERPDAKWIYVCDSDTYPDPSVRKVMREFEAFGSHWLYSLYRSSYQERVGRDWYATKNVWPGPRPGSLNLLERRAAPGCALLVDASALRELGAPFGITEEAHRENHGTWDHVLASELGPVGVLDTSYVDHLGRGGLHNPTWDVDQAENPTPALVATRPHLIARIEAAERATRSAEVVRAKLARPLARRAVDARPDRQAGYDPGRYWPERLAAEGPTYVGAGGARGAEAQADAFWRALRPVIEQQIPVRRYLPNLLDFGCGTGRLTRRLVELDFSYHGCDVNEGAVRAVNELAVRERLAPVAAGPSRLPLGYPDEYFTAVVAVTVLQHVPDRLIEATCAELARVLAPGGRIFLLEDANPEGAQPAPHMAFRGAQEYAKLFGMRPVHYELVSAERPQSHYLAVFERAA